MTTVASHRPAESCDKPVPSSLNDDVLREIFAFCLSYRDEHSMLHMWAWKSLAQVCKQWRETIYASQHYLDLFLYYHSNGRRVEETIDSCPWPEFPLALDFSMYELEEDADYLRLCAALVQRDRICRIKLFMAITGANWGRFAMLMEEAFPQLTHLELISFPISDLPYISFDRFLGGSAPSLQHLYIDDFEYGGLPSLLSSAPNLVSLQIKNIRPACYMPPEAVVGENSEDAYARAAIPANKGMIPH